MSAPPRRPVPVLRGARVTLRPPAPTDSEVARRIGLHPEILLGYGEELEDWRELTVAEAAELLARLAPDEDKVEWVVEADGVCMGTARLHSVEEPHCTAAQLDGRRRLPRAVSLRAIAAERRAVRLPLERVCKEAQMAGTQGGHHG